MTSSDRAQWREGTRAKSLKGRSERRERFRTTSDIEIADVYDDEVDNSVAALTSMLEPLMIVVLALVVGLIVMALFLPLVKIIGSLSSRT